jgi:hypothetical protein
MIVGGKGSTINVWGLHCGRRRSVKSKGGALPERKSKGTVEEVEVEMEWVLARNGTQACPNNVVKFGYDLLLRA